MFFLKVVGKLQEPFQPAKKLFGVLGVVPWSQHSVEWNGMESHLNRTDFKVRYDLLVWETTVWKEFVLQNPFMWSTASGINLFERKEGQKNTNTDSLRGQWVLIFEYMINGKYIHFNQFLHPGGWGCGGSYVGPPGMMRDSQHSWPLSKPEWFHRIHQP